MPMYLGQDVPQSFLDMICRVFYQQYEAAHPSHAHPSDTPENRVALLQSMENARVTGGPEACALARETAAL